MCVLYLYYLRFVKKLKNDLIIIHQRVDKKLSTNQTSTLDLTKHASDIIKEGHILWTHVTSPLTDSFSYDKIIKA